MRLTFGDSYFTRLSRRRHLVAVAGALLFCLAQAAPVSAQRSTQVRDASPLKPPPGHKVAIIEFYDLQCPLCARTNLSLISAANQYKIPWIRHDLLIPGHPWSRQAAINARFFDTKSVKLGNDYRDYIFANQNAIEIPAQLQQFTQRFADTYKVPLPFAIDPTGRFAAEIQADVDLSRRIGVDHTPTIFVVASGGHAPPYTEVVDPNRLFQTIDQVLAQVKQ